MTYFGWERKKPPLGLTRILQAQRNEGRERDLRQYVENNRKLIIRNQWEASAVRSQPIRGHFNSEATNERPPRPLVSDILKQEAEEKKAAKLLAKENARKRREQLLEKAKEYMANSHLEKVKVQGDQGTKSTLFF